MHTMWSIVGNAARVLALLGVAGIAHAQTPGRITLAEAQSLIAAAHADAASKNLNLSVAVVDARGDLIAVGRMANANPGTVDVAIGKAMASAIFGQPSAALVARANTPVLQVMNGQTGGRLRFLQGAVLIVRGGLTVGAIAGSGATGQQDEDSAKAALTAAPLR